MASIRLTKSDRQEIVERAMARSEIVKKIKEHGASGYPLAEDVRVHLLGGKAKAAQLEELDKQFQALRDKAPAELVPFNSTLFYYRSSIRVAWEGGTCVLDFGAHRICLAQYQHHLDDVPELCKRVVNFFETRNKLKRERTNFRKTLEACMETATTTKKLLTIWPEAEALLPEHLLEATKVTPKLPALPTNKLNKALNLVPTAAKKKV